jgi:hypothetical protein
MEHFSRFIVYIFYLFADRLRPCGYNLSRQCADAGARPLL